MAAPVKQTCPDINRVIKWVNNAMNEAQEGVSMEDLSDIKVTFKEIVSQLDGVEQILEELRDANSSLRDWGDDMESEKEKLEEEVSALEDKIYNLTTK